MGAGGTTRAARWPKVTAVAAALTLAAGGVTAAALARQQGAATGNPKAGKSLFISTCGACHTLSAAKTAGTIGPNLDKVMLGQATIVKAIDLGGAAVMAKAALAKYPTRMTPYKGVLTPAQVQDVAAFVFVSTHTVAAPKITLKAAGHTPKIKVRWKYAVHAVTGGKAAVGRVTVQIVDPIGHAHPVQLGTSKKNIVNRRFKGTFASFVVWPASSRGVHLTFRVTVHVGTTKKVVSYRVTPGK